MIVRPASQAIVALTFAIYAVRPFYEADCTPSDDTLRLLAASCICEYRTWFVFISYYVLFDRVVPRDCDLVRT